MSQPSTSSVYHVEMRSYRSIGWGCLILFLIFFVFALVSGEVWPALVFLLFSLLGLYLVLGSGSFDFTSDGVSHKTAFGRWYMAWDEVSSVEVGKDEGTYILYGNDKRFVISPPGWWYGPQKEDAFYYLLQQLQERQLALEPTLTAAYKIMKNTKVP